MKYKPNIMHIIGGAALTIGLVPGLAAAATTSTESQLNDLRKESIQMEIHLGEDNLASLKAQAKINQIKLSDNSIKRLSVLLSSSKAELEKNHTTSSAKLAHEAGDLAESLFGNLNSRSSEAEARRQVSKSSAEHSIQAAEDRLNNLKLEIHDKSLQISTADISKLDNSLSKAKSAFNGGKFELAKSTARNLFATILKTDDKLDPSVENQLENAHQAIREAQAERDNLQSEMEHGVKLSAARLSAIDNSLQKANAAVEAGDLRKASQLAESARSNSQKLDDSVSGQKITLERQTELTRENAKHLITESEARLVALDNRRGALMAEDFSSLSNLLSAAKASIDDNNLSQALELARQAHDAAERLSGSLHNELENEIHHGMSLNEIRGPEAEARGSAAEGEVGNASQIETHNSASTPGEVHGGTVSGSTASESASGGSASGGSSSGGGGSGGGGGGH